MVNKRLITVGRVEGTLIGSFSGLILVFGCLELYLRFWPLQHNSVVEIFKFVLHAYSYKFFLAQLPLIVVHELIHGLVWSFFSKTGWKSIKIGVFWNSMVPYCHCGEPLNCRGYILGCVAPSLFLGLLPISYGLIYGNLFVVLTGVFGTVISVGDWIISLKVGLFRKDGLIKDLSTAPGCELIFGT